ncbi:MAG: hypothetical protein KKC64_02860 [Spirochaetes bacterium]|nr:hypothetical protein [Spirochaetota bacterium]
MHADFSRRLLCSLILSVIFLSSVSANPIFGAPEKAVPAAPTVQPGAWTGLQVDFRERMAQAFEAFLAEPGSGPLLLILGMAFVYGLFHAAGPGHRKTIIFSLFLARQTKAWEPLLAGFLSAVVHSAAGGLILLLLSLLRGALASRMATETLVLWLDGFTLLILVAVALWLILRTLRRLVRNESHEHATHGRTIYSILALSSLVPCPGTIMVLMFAFYMNQPIVGILAVASMSVAMGLVISAAAYLAWFGRSGLFMRLKAREKTMERISAFFELGSYSLILFFSLFTAWPFLVSLPGLIG